jgi:hypothetical protein
MEMSIYEGQIVTVTTIKGAWSVNFFKFECQKCAEIDENNQFGLFFKCPPSSCAVITSYYKFKLHICWCQK